MTAYLLRRLGTSIIVLIGISIFIYLMLHAIFPSPARAVARPAGQQRADRRVEQGRTGSTAR